MLYTNIRSIFFKHLLSQSCVENSKYNIILLSECWIQNEAPLPPWPEYQAVSCPSVIGKAGGVVAYIDSTLKMTKDCLLYTSPSPRD